MNKFFHALLLSTVLTLPFTVNATEAAKTKTSAPTPTKQSADDVAKFDMQMAGAQKNMQKMQEQMEKINQTQDPQERQQLLKEHWETMRSSMGMMHGMMGYMCCPMMGGNMMGWHNMHGYYSKLSPEQIKKRQYMADQYMKMQNMMMDNMMQHQNQMMQPSQ